MKILIQYIANVFILYKIYMLYKHVKNLFDKILLNIWRIKSQWNELVFTYDVTYNLMNIRWLVVQHEFYLWYITTQKLSIKLGSHYRSDYILRVFILLNSSRSGDTIRSRFEMILDDQCSFALLLHCSILLNIAQHCSIMLDTDRLQELTDESKIICSHYR